MSALVRDPEQRVRLEVVRALCALRDLSGIPALVTALQDGDATVRDESISALVEIYAERDRTGPVGRFLENFSDEYERSSVPPFTVVDPSVFRGLSAVMKGDERAELRANAAYAIGILGGGSSIPDLVAALQDPAGEVRAAAATALGKTATAEEGRALIPLLADSNTTVRNRALQSIGVLRVHEAGPALREMFVQHRRRDLGTRVLASLARTGDPAQGDLYRELLFSNDPEQRRLAVEGLARISTPAMLPAFKTDFQRERNGDVRIAYAFAIARLGDRAFLDSLVLALGGSGATAGHARDLLIELGPDDRTRPLRLPERPRPGRARGRRRPARRPRRHERHAAPDAAARRPQLPGGRSRQPRDREASPAGRGALAAVKGRRSRAAALLLLLLGAGCGGRDGSDAGAAADPLAEARGLLAERRYDDVLARVGEAADPDAAYLAGRAWAGKAESAPVPTPAPGVAGGERSAQAGRRARRSRFTSAPSPRAPTSWTPRSHSRSCWRRTRWRPWRALPGRRPGRRPRAARPARRARAAELRRRAAGRPGRHQGGRGPDRLRDPRRAPGGGRRRLPGARAGGGARTRPCSCATGTSWPARPASPRRRSRQYAQALIWKPADDATKLKMAEIHLAAAAVHLRDLQYVAAEARLKDARRYTVDPASPQAARLAELEGRVREVRGR